MNSPRATLGPKPSYVSSPSVSVNVSEDGRAFLLGFDGTAEAKTDEQSEAPIATAVASLAIPVHDAGETQEIGISMAVYAFTAEGAWGNVLLCVNGQTKGMQFGPGMEEVERVLNFDVLLGATSECRISIFVEAERSPTAAFSVVSVSDFSAELLPRAG